MSLVYQKHTMLKTVTLEAEIQNRGPLLVKLKQKLENAHKYLVQLN